MKFSELWLREWINPNLNSAQLCDQMTMIGLEVENISSVADLFCGVLTGKIIECKEKNEFNSIKFTKVDVGDGNILNIVCSSSNCRLGLKVAVATVGTKLPKNILVKKTEFFGTISEGIICSLNELGISDSTSESLTKYKNNSIIELPINTPIGKDVYSYFKFNDNIIDINITPNRADCLSIIGIARDIAALNCLSLKKLIINPITAKTDSIIPIHIEESNSCPRYLARVIKDININITTPFWMKEKLRRCGIISIDILTDINNYIMIEIGQPIQSYDLDNIDGHINVRMAKKSERLTLCNGKNIELNDKTLVIADQNKILSIAGICKGFHSNINNNTKNVLLECAYFNPLSIINNACYYNLHNDISHRYERGIDHKLQYKSLELATKLLLEICKGKPGPIIDKTYVKSLPSELIINLHRETLDRIIGFKIPDYQVNNILKRLGFKVNKIKHNWKIKIPSWRVDIFIEEDVIEEIIRIFGYNNIQNIPMQTNLKIIDHDHYETIFPLKRAKHLLVDKGYQEVITYSFVDPKLQTLFFPNQKAIKIVNPISQEMSVMRLSLWTNLIKTLNYNNNHQQNRIRLFESGYCFFPDKKFELGVRQEFMLSGLISGNKFEDHWDCKSQPVDFYDLKGDLESLFELFKEIDDIVFRSALNPALHPGKSAEIYLNNKKIGLIGIIHPNLKNKLKIKNETIVFELFWNDITDCKSIMRIKEISYLPTNRRDISFIVNEKIPIANIIALCKKIGINQLVGINLLDVYRGKGISKGYKSLTISLILQDTKRTLKEEEISMILNKYIIALKERFQVTLRN
ncbi:phenylalanine--tRNA ligase subunit beta [Candidatus Pantoea edessiphila]|uniref:Phenylalanine--tRNA ligase beta subunit n=1 Tax=Candidatus Pantoea edessiphila TaxID=2044610 RepID=A0A2P5T2I4_9GAMM|nr:phenylalanine--tRNA ligase subunit beta [Candidatus Pantoea edessiphila]PPI88801.1 phenylalanine--tRNA ligase subunit beta [Candidatus Pantoea edessiphila]